MSAIYGLWRSEPFGRSSELDSMSAKLSHRGDHDARSLGQCALGTRRWASEHLDATLTEHRPLRVAGDLRLDNRCEILGLVGQALRNSTDLQLVGALFARHGPPCFARLVGDFAIALWDESEKKLYCARDHLGVRPFYYRSAPGRFFAFATEIKALLEFGVPRLNEARIADYLLQDFSDVRATFYSDIYRLKPASYLAVTDCNVQEHSYWQIATGIRAATEREAVSGLKERLEEAVRCRVSDAPRVGVFLSGGLDSATVACLATRNAETHAFSAVFPTVPASDESTFIQTVCRECSAQPHRVVADQVNLFLDPREVYRFHDEPVWAPNSYISWALYAAAKNESVRVVLDGVDGDTVISHGLGHLSDLARSLRWDRFLRETWSLTRNWRSFLSMMVFRGFGSWLPAGAWPVFRVVRSFFTNEDLFASTFAKRVDLRARRRDSICALPLPCEGELQSHLRRIGAGLLPTALETNDQTASVHGVTPRHPFFDVRLVDYCVSLAGDLKLRGGQTRWVLREAMRGVIPELVRTRRKTDLAHAFVRGMATAADSISELLNAPGQLDEYVNMDALRRMFAEFMRDRRPQSGMRLWMPVTLGFWLRYGRANGHNPAREARSAN